MKGLATCSAKHAVKVRVVARPGRHDVGVHPAPAPPRAAVEVVRVKTLSHRIILIVDRPQSTG